VIEWSSNEFMPPHHPHDHPPATAAFIDLQRIDALIAPFVPDAESRAFVVRCLLGEGPTHHRGANFVVLALLGQVLEKLGGAKSTGEQLPVAMRLPPHLARAAGPQAYPLGLSVEALERLAPKDSRNFEAMVDCLCDGPPQHALANAAMVDLLGAILARLEADGR
jgi:hypothetical protein